MSASATVVRMNTNRADHVRTEWKVVTPELAERWLEGNTHNRALRQARVDEFVAILKAGEWKQTHQGVAFSDEDPPRLIDGQHRLYAIWESKIPGIMQVTYGLPFDTQKVIDQVTPRSTLDVARIFDKKLPGITRLHVSAANRFRYGLDARSSSDKITRIQELQFLEQHYEAVDFAVTAMTTQKKIKGVTSAGVLAAIARAYGHLDRALLSKFARVLVEGVTTDDRDRVVIRLRDWLREESRIGAGEFYARECYGRTERALDFFSRGVTLGRNFLPVTTELYPIVKGGGR